MKIKFIKNNIKFFLLAIFLLISFFNPYYKFVGKTQAASLQATLVRTINTYAWNPVSPDPSGLTYWPAHKTYLSSDGEVEEMPPYYAGVNVYEMKADGTLVATYTTASFSNEPTGVAINSENGHIFFSDDNRKRVNEVNPGTDGIYGTVDDTVTFFSTSAFGSNDPEGLAFGAGKIFIADGVGKEVYIVNPGDNGLFDGVAPNGDDQMTHFDTAILNLSDPEGIEFNPDNNTLFVTGGSAKLVLETSLTGSIVNTIDITFLSSKKRAGLAYGPGSVNPDVKSLYISDRGVDNDSNPNENDGKIYEISWQMSPTPTVTITPADQTVTPTPSETPTPTFFPTETPIPTPSPMETPTPTETPVPSPTGQPSITPIPTATPTSTPSPVQNSVNLLPIADTHVRSDNPNINYGTRISAKVDGSPIAISYLKFDLVSLSGKVINNAKLNIRIYSDPSSATQSVKSVDDNNWTETDLTYNNRPGLGNLISTFTSPVTETWTEIDVSSEVISKQGQIMSLGIDEIASNGVTFYTRESANKPYLQVRFN